MIAMPTDPPIPDSYWVEPGRFLAGEYPGAREEDAALAKVGALLDAGVRLFVDLTEAGEYNLRPYWPLVQQLAGQRGEIVEHRRLSIPDMGTPSSDTMRRILDTIDGALAVGKTVYVHCFGGIGRTGTVVGCYLVRHGMDGATALGTIAQRRQGTPDGHKRSPETDAQRVLVTTWQNESFA
jgi:hypothetical protein